MSVGAIGILGVLGLLAPLAVRLGPRGSANEASNIEILRGHLLETQGRLGDAAVISSARQQLDSGAGTPAEVATLVAWLASDECTFTTGAVHDLSGGRATY